MSSIQITSATMVGINVLYASFSAMFISGLSQADILLADQLLISECRCPGSWPGGNECYLPSLRLISAAWMLLICALCSFWVGVVAQVLPSHGLWGLIELVACCAITWLTYSSTWTFGLCMQTLMDTKMPHYPGEQVVPLSGFVPADGIAVAYILNATSATPLPAPCFSTINLLVGVSTTYYQALSAVVLGWSIVVTVTLCVRGMWIVRQYRKRPETTSLRVKDTT